MKKNYIKWLFLFFAVQTTLSCASWDLKDRCEKQNWFEYSQKLAFSGKYLEEDQFVKECKGVDRTNATQLDLGFKLGREKMCSYDEIYLRATQGQPVFFKFCDGLDMFTMKKKFSDGLLVYCTPTRGYEFGKTGQVYQKVCSANQEIKFLPSYYKGRKEFLTQFLNDKKSVLAQQESLLKSLNINETNASNAYSSIPHVLNCETIKVYNEATKANESKTVCSEPYYIQNQRSRLYNDLLEARKSLRAALTNHQLTRDSIDWAEKELMIIPVN